MDTVNTPPELVQAASDPHIDPEYLRRLAYYYPVLRPQIAQNPAAYDGLLQWLANMGVDQAHQALQARKNNAASDKPSAQHVPNAHEANDQNAPEANDQETARLEVQTPVQLEVETPEGEASEVETPEGEASEVETPEGETLEGEASEGEAPDDQQPPAQQSEQHQPVSQGATEVLPSLSQVPNKEAETQAYGNWQYGAIQGEQAPQGQGIDRQPLQASVPDAPFRAVAATPAPAAGPEPAAAEAAASVPGPRPIFATPARVQAVGPKPVPVPPAETKKTWPTIVITVLAVLTLVLAAFALLLYAGKISLSATAPSVPDAQPTPGFTDDQGGDQSTLSESSNDHATLSASPMDQTTSSASPTQTPSASDQSVRYPAPNGAVEGTGFNAPSYNLMCLMRPDHATCTVIESTWTNQTMDKCSSDPQTVTVSADGSQLACDNPALGDGYQLEYNQTMVQGDMACSLTIDGVSCWNTRSGQSIAIAREGWLKGSSGPIDPAAIP